MALGASASLFLMTASQTGYAETGKLTLNALALPFLMARSQTGYSETGLLTINSGLSTANIECRGSIRSLPDWCKSVGGAIVLIPSLAVSASLQGIGCET